jgi:UDP-glucose 4-epimerase
MQTFIVTGCAGFLGANLVERLLAAGHRVLGVDNLSMGRIENISEFTGNPLFSFLRADVTEAGTFATLESALQGPPTALIHLAARKIPRYGKAIETLQVNYRGTEQALESARRLGCRFVLASTSDVYGRNPALPFSEERTDSVIGNSKSPRWAYAVSKLFDEHMALAYREAYGFPATILRFFGSYGPKQNLTWWGGPQSVFIDCVLNDKPIPIHGTGAQTRSFTYVSDTIDGIVAASTLAASDGQIINIGNDQEITILELACRIHRLAGGNGEPRIEMVPYESFTGAKYEDVMRRVPDVQLCQRLLGVRAHVDIDAGLGRTIDWQRGLARA